MIFLVLMQLGAFVAIAASAPVAPWWAAPFERIIIAFVTIIPPTAAIFWNGVKTRHRIDVKRTESQGEHRIGLDEAKRREVDLAAKVEAAAQTLASKVETTTATIRDAIAENTAISTEAKAGALRAYEEANSVNVKIADTNERISDAINAGRTERSHIAHIPEPPR